MPLLLIAGVIILIIGLIFLFSWWANIIILVKAVLPFAIITIGAVISYLGWERLIDKRRECTFQDSSVIQGATLNTEPEKQPDDPVEHTDENETNQQESSQQVPPSEQQQ